MVSPETLNTTERFFRNTEADPMNPRLILCERLIELGYGFRLDLAYRPDGSTIPGHVAIHEFADAYKAFCRVAQDPEFDVLSQAYDLSTYIGSAPQMDHCNWPKEMKKKIAAWAMENTATRLEAMAANVDTSPWYRDVSDEKKDQVRKRCAREAEDAKKKAYMLGGLTPSPALSLLELESLVRNSVRQALFSSN